MQQKKFKMQIGKETWHAKCLSFEVEVHLFKEQN